MSKSKGTHMQRISIAFGLVLGLSAFAAGCTDEDGGQANSEGPGGSATETNAQPAPGKADDDCPGDIECVFAGADAQTGFCNVAEMVVDGGSDAGPDGSMGPSSAAPAPCQSNADCPDGIACVSPDGEGGPGFCDVEEMGVIPSSPAPAPCTSDDDCPEGIECVSFDNGGPGFCDVNEMIEP